MLASLLADCLEFEKGLHHQSEFSPYFELFPLEIPNLPWFWLDKHLKT